MSELVTFVHDALAAGKKREEIGQALKEGGWSRDEVENALAEEAGLQPGELLLDYPVKTQMLGLDLLVQRRRFDRYPHREKAAQRQPKGNERTA